MKKTAIKGAVVENSARFLTQNTIVMQKLFSSGLLLLFLLGGITACEAQQAGAYSRDAPVVAENDTTMNANPFGESFNRVAQQASQIEAFLLDPYTVDSTGTTLLGFKVLQHEPEVAAAEAAALRALLQDTTEGAFSPSEKRCGLPANLAFRFTDGDTAVTLLVALDCDVVHASTKEEVEDHYAFRPPANLFDTDLLHADFSALKTAIFEAPSGPLADSSQTAEVEVVNETATPTEVESTNTAETPPTAIATIEHQVAAGESLKDVAQQYNVTEAAIKQWNNLSSDQLTAGATLRIEAADSE